MGNIVKTGSHVQPTDTFHGLLILQNVFEAGGQPQMHFWHIQSLGNVYVGCKCCDPPTGTKSCPPNPITFEGRVAQQIEGKTTLTPPQSINFWHKKGKEGKRPEGMGEIMKSV